MFKTNPSFFFRGPCYLRFFFFLFLCSFSGSAPASADSYAANGFLFGTKMQQNGQPFTIPGATLSIRAASDDGRIRMSEYRQSFGPDIPSFKTPLSPGRYEIGMQVPDGFEAYYALCTNCENTSPSDYKPYGAFNGESLILTIASGQNVSLNWMFVPQEHVQVPTDIASENTLNLTPQEFHNAEEGLSQHLTCNVPGVPHPLVASDTTLFKQGTDAWAAVGINSHIGDIAVSLKLINPQSPDQPLELIDARSASGAAWQSTMGIIGEMRDAQGRLSYPIAHFNQGAGNSAMMWGFEGGLKADPETGLVQKYWVPLFSNDVETGVGTGISQLTTPCYHTGIRFGNGRIEIVPSTIPISIKGEPKRVLRLTSTYQFRSVGRHAWNSSFVPSADEQALYFLRAATNPQNGNLRIYFMAPDNKTMLGPIRPHDTFSHLAFDVSQIDKLNCPADRPDRPCFLKTLPTTLAVLVWNVAGRDIAMAIHGSNVIKGQPNPQFIGVINLRQISLCKDASNDSCGNVQWHTVFNFPPQGVIENGETITQTIHYDIGSVADIEALGYKLPDLGYIKNDETNVSPPIDTKRSSILNAATDNQINPTPSVSKRTYTKTEAANIINNIAYGSSTYEKLDLCLPDPSVRRTTAVIAMHGGGLFSGDKAMLTKRMCAWFQNKGILVASINYRIVENDNGVSWPDPLADAQLAVRWLRAHAADYGFTLKRLCSIGGSSGGYLALFLDELQDPVASDVADLIPGYSSGTDCAFDQWGPTDYTHPSPVMKKTLSLLFPNTAAGDLVSKTKSMSPLFYVRRGIGPVFVVQGSADVAVPPDQSVRLIEALQEKGISHQLKIFRGGHGMLSADWDELSPTAVDFVLNSI